MCFGISYKLFENEHRLRKFLDSRKKIVFLILTHERFLLDDHKIAMKCPVKLHFNNITLTPVGVAQRPVQRWDRKKIGISQILFLYFIKIRFRPTFSRECLGNPCLYW